MTEQVKEEKKVYKTCPFGKPNKAEYSFALCNTKYCELWNKRGECCSLYFLSHLADILDVMMDAR